MVAWWDKGQGSRQVVSGTVSMFDTQLNATEHPVNVTETGIGVSGHSCESNLCSTSRRSVGRKRGSPSNKNHNTETIEIL